MPHPIIADDLRAITGHDLPWAQLEGQTILITGANGFVPAYLVESILYLNETSFNSPATVIALTRDRERAAARFAAYRGRPELRWHFQDVCAPVELDTRVDYVIHGACSGSPKSYLADPAATLAACALGTSNVLQLARAHRVRAFLFISSGEVYGQVSAGQLPTPEGQFGPLDPTDPRSCYAEGKRLAESLCSAWHRQFGTPTKVARLFHTYGPGMRLDDGRVYADFVADLVAGRDLVVKGDGRRARAFCYLADAAAGLFTVLFRGERGQAYNIGNERCETTILRLAETLVSLFPEKRLRAVRGALDSASCPPSPLLRSCPDTTRLRRLGWEPRTPLREGFLRTVRSYS